MSDLRSALVAARLSTYVRTADDGFPSLVVRGDEEAADVAMEVLSDPVAVLDLPCMAEVRALVVAMNEERAPSLRSLLPWWTAWNALPDSVKAIREVQR